MPTSCPKPDCPQRSLDASERERRERADLLAVDRAVSRYRRRVAGLEPWPKFQIPMTKEARS